MFEWLRAAGRPSSSPACGSDEQTLIAPSPLGGRGLFARRALAAGEPIHVVPQRTSSAAGRLKEDVLSPRAVGDARAARQRARTRTPGCCRATTIPSQHCPSCGATTSSRCCRTTPSSTSPRRRARAGGAEAWHAELAAALGGAALRSTRCAGRARCCSLGRSPLAARRRRTRGATSCCRSSTWRILTSAARSAPTCAFLRRADAVPAHMRGSGSKFAALGGGDVAEGEELLLDYGPDLTRTRCGTHYPSWNRRQPRRRQLPRRACRAAGGLFAVRLLWCIDNAPTTLG